MPDAADLAGWLLVLYIPFSSSTEPVDRELICTWSISILTMIFNHISLFTFLTGASPHNILCSAGA